MPLCCNFYSVWWKFVISLFGLLFFINMIQNVFEKKICQMKRKKWKLVPHSTYFYMIFFLICLNMLIRITLKPYAIHNFTYFNEKAEREKSYLPFPSAFIRINFYLFSISLFFLFFPPFFFLLGMKLLKILNLFGHV